MASLFFAGVLFAAPPAANRGFTSSEEVRRQRSAINPNGCGCDTSDRKNPGPVLLGNVSVLVAAVNAGRIA